VISALGDDELLARVMGGPNALSAARGLLDCHGLDRLPYMLAAELSLEPGIGRRRAASVAAAFEVGRRAAVRWPARGWQVRTPADVAERLLPEMGHLDREEMLVGNLAGSPVRIGEVYREAIRRQAAAVIVAHNHPSGDPSPSGDDLRITADLADAGRLLDIELLDHLVIGHDRWVSLRAAGAL